MLKNRKLIIKSLRLYSICLVALLCTMIMLPLHAQGVSSPFGVLTLPYSARLNALGCDNVSLNDGDLSMVSQNPALLSASTHIVAQVNYAFLGKGLNLANVMYGHNFGGKHSPEGEKHNYLAFSIQYLDYGKMEYADDIGTRFGTFSAKDFVISATYARQLGEYFTIGASLKPVYSVYERYTSFALAADVGAHYHTSDKRFQLGLSLLNIGWQLKSFYSEDGDQHRENLPLDLKLGLSYKLRHAPLRFSATFHHLQKWNIGYSSNGGGVHTITIREMNRLKDEGGNVWLNAKQNGAVLWYDMLFRHTTFALDIVPKSERFYLTLSYSHRRHAELVTGDGFSLAGFGLGVGINIKQFKLAFATSQYVKGNMTFQATIAANIGSFLK